MSGRLLPVAVIALIVCVLVVLALLRGPKGAPEAHIPAGTPFTYSFKVPGVLNEAGEAHETSSPYWWLNSGGELVIATGTGMTMFGETEEESLWRRIYREANPKDTDGGAHPQNLFRLLSRSEWHNVRLSAGFRIVADNLSTSENRNESNGLLLMSRYLDSNHLYYAGVRVDGHAVIKKKYGGVYYTMAEHPVFKGFYDRERNPSLLPHDSWITLRSETVSEGETVHIRLSVEESGEWKELLTASDDGATYGGTPIIDTPAAVGIRTDFMDVEFRDFRAEPL